MFISVHLWLKKVLEKDLSLKNLAQILPTLRGVQNDTGKRVRTRVLCIDLLKDTQCESYAFFKHSATQSSMLRFSSKVNPYSAAFWMIPSR